MRGVQQTLSNGWIQNSDAKRSIHNMGGCKVLSLLAAFSLSKSLVSVFDD
ncbi:hypothetical protein J529_3837 [Acinetobacter baumannii 99063]|uniref:Uncharacterized protein n=1 Tax=Acinetobacter baumannii 99063 TaxID=1310630 RepID=A0A009RVJ6_ACIBA|nr:hypothetical protein J529_3837 [Acinetobacter baumannii 99063]